MSTRARDQRLRRSRAGAAALAVTLLLGACSSQLPTTSQPRAGLPVSVQTQRSVERFLSLPQEGDSPSEIVRGFLRANVGFADDRDVARAFLTELAASQWVPTQDVLVYDGTPEVAQEDGTRVQVNVNVAGRIDAEGRLTELDGRTTSSQTFTLSRVAGEWRISGFPEGFGVWLSRDELETSFRPTTLYYLNPHGNTFVPEVRWLALGEGRPTALTRAQLAPLPEHLVGVLRTAAGEDVRLAVPSVPVDPDTSVATVSLQGAGLVAGSDSTVALQSQLSHALLGLSGVSGVEVQVGGQPLPLGDSTGPITSGTPVPYSDYSRDADMVLLRVGERFSPVDPGHTALRDLPLESVGGLVLPRLGMSWSGVAATADLQDFAAVSNDRTKLWRWQEGDTYTNAGIGDQLTPPAVDRLGAFWVGGVHRSSGSPRVWFLDRAALTSTARPLEVDGLRDRDRIHSLSVSPDGSRLLIVVGDGTTDRHRLLLVGIERDAEGEPTGLTGPVSVAPSLVDVTSARWASIGELFLVARRDQDPQPRAFSLRLGEWLTPIGAGDQLTPVDLVAVPDGTGALPIAVTADGRFHTTEGAQGWYAARNGDEIVVPGS